MTKYQQGFPVNENGEIVLSGTNQAVVGTLPIDMLPVDDNGGLKLGNVATLVTDAGGGPSLQAGGSEYSFHALQRVRNLGTKVFAGQAYSDTGLNRTYLTGIALEQHFDAVRIGFYNANTATAATLKCAVAVGPDASNKTGAGLTWINGTFAGAATVTPAAASDAANPPLTWTDWIAINSVPRTDGGKFPLLYVESFVASGGGNTTVHGTAGSIATITNDPAGRIGWTFSVTGDSVGATVSSPARDVTNFGVIQYLARGKVITVAAFGDSITAGSSAVRAYQSWAYKACAQLSDNYGMSIQYANCGWAGQTTAQILTRLTYNLPLMTPDVVLIPAFSPNDASPPTAASIAAQRSNLVQAVNLCRQYGAIPIIWTGIPKSATATTAAWTQVADDLRKALNASVLNEYGTAMITMDLASVMGDGSSPERIRSAALGYPADLSTDWLHPNDAGYEAMAAVAAPQIAKICRMF